MGGLWTELAKKLAERWLSLLVLPGAVYLGVAVVAAFLGHGHAFDIGLIVHQITGQIKDPTSSSVGGQIFFLVAALVAAAAVGLVAEALGAFAESVLLASSWSGWPPPAREIALRRIEFRQRRWDSANSVYLSERRRGAEAVGTMDISARLSRASRIRIRIAVERPERPTWGGDRINAAAIRLDRDYELDLMTVWPALWFVLPDQVRDEVNSSRANLSRAAALIGWSALYLALVPWWWPASLLAAVLAATGYRRFKRSADTYAIGLEMAVRVYSTNLASQLGIIHVGPLDKPLGRILTGYLREGALPPAS